MSILIRNARTIATCDDQDQVFIDTDMLIDGKKITRIGKNIAAEADRVIDARSMIVLPGFINTHHHLYQTLTRVVPQVQDAELFDWLVQLYEIWRGITPEAVHTGALVGLGELMLTGCTTAADHHYVYPRNFGADPLAEEIRAAQELGIRFHPTRGSMSRGKSDGGLPPDDLVQSEDEILRHSEAAIATHHDPEPFSMCRIALAPCSPFSVTTELLRDSAQLARDKGVRLHTHLAETLDEETYCLEMHGLRPLEYMEKVDWLGDDVWYAHGVHLNPAELDLMARTGTGVAHCPVSNLRLGSGIAPVPTMMKKGVPVGLAVDGSASNDSSNMLKELQVCLLAHRIGEAGPTAMGAMEVLRMATRGGARVLGRNDIGMLAPGMAADVILYNVDELGFAGASHDIIAALLFCGTSQRVHTSIINGQVVVDEGRLIGLDEKELVEKANRIALELTAKARNK